MDPLDWVETQEQTPVPYVTDPLGWVESQEED